MTDRRWAWAEIDLGALDYNVREFKKLLSPRTRLMAVVKADAYGHGAVKCAFAALVAGADRFGVATVDEAIALREGGIEAPIQLLSEPPVTAISDLLHYNIIPAVTSEVFLGELSSAATLRGGEALYHLVVNTGMNRIGFRPDDIARVANLAHVLPHIRLEGVFTHFATADVEGDWDAQKQLTTFTRAVDSIRSNDIDPGIVHCANTPATILLPETHFDMVRVGIGLYGLHPSEATKGRIDLEPVMTVKARASLVKPISLGEGVSYGLTWHAFERADIATLPLGYADGVPRIASNNLECLVRGKRVPQVGRVCMDQFMCEVDPDAHIAAGEEFVLIGRQGDERISMDEVAQKSDTINYEIACALGSMRLERIYV